MPVLAMHLIGRCRFRGGDGVGGAGGHFGTVDQMGIDILRVQGLGLKKLTFSK